MDGSEFFTFVIGIIVGAFVGFAVTMTEVDGTFRDHYGVQYCAPACGEGKYEVTYNKTTHPKHWGCVCLVEVK